MAESQYKYKEVLHTFCSIKKLPPPSYGTEDEEDGCYCEVSNILHNTFTCVCTIYVCTIYVCTIYVCTIYVCTNQLRVHGFDFVASGEAGSKVEAQRIAAKAFCEYLIAQKQLQPHELVSSVFMLCT